MSGWTILTVRGKNSEDYDRSEHNSTDPWDATADICATFEQDDRIHEWTSWSGHVYALLNCERYNFAFAQRLVDDYSEMIADFVILGANDTTDTGTARYYPSADTPARYIDEYEEHQGKDGTHVGMIALSAINARHGIVARDPFSYSTKVGVLDERYEDTGTCYTSNS